jgi:hypothetical protein
MHTNKTFAIYWIPSGYSVSANYTSLINRFFTDVAGASGSTGNVYASDTQYYDNVNGNILYSSSFGGAYIDTSPLPPSGCVDSYTSVCLTDVQIQQEIQRVVALKGWQAGPSSLVFMFTAKGIGSCFASGSCAFSYYCAYHSNIGSGSNEILYANQPYADTAPSACDAGPHPNGDDADATLNVTSHEHNEAITDPLGNAWYDSAGNENGDKCAWNFGSPLGSTVNGQYNQLINGNPYYLQLEWSNATANCVGAYGTVTAPVNTALPVVSGTAQVGQTLSASTGSWSGSTPMSFAYQWRRCDSGGAGCVDVGLNQSTYALTSADLGSTVRVAVTASNGGGSALATSAQSAVVAASSSTTVTFVIGAGADDGHVLVNNMGTGLPYPPSTSPSASPSWSSISVRRAGPLFNGYEVSVGLLRFDTSSLPDNAVVNSAVLRLYAQSRTSVDNRDLVAEWYPASNWPIDGADWTVTPSSTASAGLALRSLVTGAFNALPLTGLASISTTGSTGLRLHVSGGQPTGENNASFAASEAGTATSAQLVVTYTLP